MEIETGLDPLATIQRLAGGHLMEDIAVMLAQVSQEVVRLDKAGSLTLTLKVTPVKNSPAVTVEESLKATYPVEKARGAMLFALNGQLYVADPRQTVLEFTKVDVPEAEIRRADDTETVVRREAE